MYIVFQATSIKLRTPIDQLPSGYILLHTCMYALSLLIQVLGFFLSSNIINQVRDPLVSSVSRSWNLMS